MVELRREESKKLTWKATHASLQISKTEQNEFPICLPACYFVFSSADKSTYKAPCWEQRWQTSPYTRPTSMLILNVLMPYL